MGWTYTHKEKGEKIKTFFEREFNGETGKVLDCATKKMVAYLAYEYLNKGTGKKEVIAVVCLIAYRKQYYNFGYKDMDETMGPFYYDCPKRILDLLTPTSYESALRWREKCRENLKGQVHSSGPALVQTSKGRQL